MKLPIAILCSYTMLSSIALAQDQIESQTEPDKSLSAQSGTQYSTPAPEANTEQISSNPQPKYENGIQYMCGGIGADESTYMKQAAKDYGLMLTFASRSGEYLANVDVTINDAKGKSILQTTCDAPILLVSLPQQGSYRIHAKAAGYEQNKLVKLSAKKHMPVKTLVFSWPRNAMKQEELASLSINDQ